MNELVEAPVMCWRRPWLLDTPEKVKWANDHRGPDTPVPWRLGDHCYYKPGAVK